MGVLSDPLAVHVAEKVVLGTDRQIHSRDIDAGNLRNAVLRGESDRCDQNGGENQTRGTIHGRDFTLRPPVYSAPNRCFNLYDESGACRARFDSVRRALISAAVEPVRLDATAGSSQAPAADLRAFVSTYCTTLPQRSPPHRRAFARSARARRSRRASRSSGKKCCTRSAPARCRRRAGRQTRGPAARPSTSWLIAARSIAPRRRTRIPGASACIA